MGFLSKVWKGVKKTVKKVARGIKKVVNKVGKAFGKLGVVGQLGLMFLMPYAMQGLGTFWQGFGGFANKLATSSNISSSLFGKTLSALHTAGNMIGKVYTGVTDTINSAFDVVTGKGKFSDLTESVKSIFSGPVDEAKSLFTGEKFKTFEKQGLLSKQETLASALEDVKKVENFKLPTIQDVIKPTDFNEKIANAFEAGVSPDELSKKISTGVAQDKMKKTLGQKILDYGSQQVENIKTAIQDFDIGEEIIGGAKVGIKESVAQQIINPRDPNYNYTTIKLPSYFGSEWSNESVFSERDFLIQNQVGNTWANTSLANYDHLQSGLLEDETSWFHNRNQAYNLIYGGNN